MPASPVPLKQITITFSVNPDTLSEDAKEDNLEGFHNLLQNLILDGLEHAEPHVIPMGLRIIQTEKES